MAHSFGPLLEVARIQGEINRLFDNLLDLRSEEAGVTSAHWMPNADIVENEEQIVVKVELPGVRVADLSLSVHQGNVIIEGEKRREDQPEDAQFHVAERAQGSFRRVVHLGVPVNTRLAEAVLNNGLLRICFPKVDNRRGEAVKIEVVSP